MSVFMKNIVLKATNTSELFKNKDLEEEINKTTKSALDKIKFSTITKPALISLIALFISFFFDISHVPILGNISVSLAKSLFQGWQPASQNFESFRFWWLPPVTYGLFILLSYLTYRKLKEEIARNPVSETIDRVVDSYTSVIDSISTALPLLGAAILLISIRLGEEVFLGLSVPFEIKALIILAIGKLFEPVLDQLSVEFQNLVSQIRDIKENYFSRIQIENKNDFIEDISSSIRSLSISQLSNNQIVELQNYKNILAEIAELSFSINNNFKSIQNLTERLNNLPIMGKEKVFELEALTRTISLAANSLNNENTLTGLKYLESIVKK